MIYRTIPPLKPRVNVDRKPSDNSLAGVALDVISSYCKQQAQKLVPDRRFDIIGEFWMVPLVQYDIARLYSSTKTKNFVRPLPFEDIQGLVVKVPSMKY